jgi:hypothetical protein
LQCRARVWRAWVQPAGQNLCSRKPPILGVFGENECRIAGILYVFVDLQSPNLLVAHCMADRTSTKLATSGRALGFGPRHHWPWVMASTARMGLRPHTPGPGRCG